MSKAPHTPPGSAARYIAKDEPGALRRLALDRIRFDLTSIRLFIATVEHGSISRAAGRQCLAVTAASRRIAELEAQFGVALFQRRPHGMVPTDAGRGLLAHARALMQSVERMHNDAVAHAQGHKGLARVAACTSAALQFLPADIRAHQEAFPDIDIETQEGTSYGVIKALVQGTAEVGIYEAGVSAPPATMRARPYREDRLVLVTHRGHPLARRRQVGFDDILLCDLVGLNEDSALSMLLVRLAASRDGKLNVRVRARSFDTMLAMIQAELGVGLVPQGVARWLAVSKAFRQVEIAEPWARRQFVLCHRHAPDISSAALSVAEFLAESAQREPLPA
ncbi:LysR family transcriptional regulator [Pigmentiphaga sp. GD03639]|uniref:LysR family transcriptional regulator n=1 Tax=Pigmentiphaga sp. GD03639 TaxID=2975354 RepID=UPI00244C03C5|nr:LysR family transcriptional regulator [Pigmentiphaga sp. GD03639]MDH2235983.1 LysR family transcriptional regulator [Pigmentiphaga sp. GD03639]